MDLKSFLKFLAYFHLLSISGAQWSSHRWRDPLGAEHISISNHRYVDGGGEETYQDHPHERYRPWKNYNYQKWHDSSEDDYPGSEHNSMGHSPGVDVEQNSPDEDADVDFEHNSPTRYPSNIEREQVPVIRQSSGARHPQPPMQHPSGFENDFSHMWLSPQSNPANRYSSDIGHFPTRHSPKPRRPPVRHSSNPYHSPVHHSSNPHPLPMRHSSNPHPLPMRHSSNPYHAPVRHSQNPEHSPVRQQPNFYLPMWNSPSIEDQPKRPIQLLHSPKISETEGATLPVRDWQHHGQYIPYNSITTCTRPGLVALTFDDGPTPKGGTEEVLEVLRRKRVKATFFVTGQGHDATFLDTDKRKQELLWRIYQEGHQIGHHTWNHPDLAVSQPMEKIHDELTRLASTVKGLIGVRMNILRPPYGSMNGTVSNIIEKDFGLKIIHWNLDTRDWAHRDNIEASFQAYKDNIPDSDPYLYKSKSFIALHHDPVPGSGKLAAMAIDYVRSRGFKLVTVGECIGRPNQG